MFLFFVCLVYVASSGKTAVFVTIECNWILLMRPFLGLDVDSLEIRDSHHMLARNLKRQSALETRSNVKVIAALLHAVKSSFHMVNAPLGKKIETIRFKLCQNYFRTRSLTRIKSSWFELVPLSSEKRKTSLPKWWYLRTGMMCQNDNYLSLFLYFSGKFFAGWTDGTEWQCRILDVWRMRREKSLIG